MPAENPIRRKRTARELAAEFDASPRTIRRKIAEPRQDFERRAATKACRARALRAQGATYKEIAKALGVPIGSVSTLLFDNQAGKASKAS